MVGPLPLCVGPFLPLLPSASPRAPQSVQGSPGVGYRRGRSRVVCSRSPYPVGWTLTARDWTRVGTPGHRSHRRSYHRSHRRRPSPTGTSNLLRPPPREYRGCLESSRDEPPSTPHRPRETPALGVGIYVLYVCKGTPVVWVFFRLPGHWVVLDGDLPSCSWKGGDPEP